MGSAGEYFSLEEIERYSRHLIIPEFNVEGQQKLKNASVLVVGAGGLGSPLLLYLAAAGVGTIGIIDYDRVDPSNLQRQVLYGASAIGKLKVEEARKRVLDLNPHLNIITYDILINSSNALDIIKDYEVVADGTDNFPTRYLVNDACVLLGKANVYASIFRFEGQVSVFNALLSSGERGPNYRDLFPTPPPPGLVPSCAEGGVLGVLPGIIGSMQALEVIKLIAGIGELLTGKLFIFDALYFSSRILRFEKDAQNPISGENPSIHGLIDYEEFCGMPSVEAELEEDLEVQEISVAQFEAWRKEKKAFQLIDVREPHEYEICNLGGDLIPLGDIGNHLEAFSYATPIIIHCRTGVRSKRAVKQLNELKPRLKAYNLKGGILAYAREIDSSIPEY